MCTICAGYPYTYDAYYASAAAQDPNYSAAAAPTADTAAPASSKAGDKDKPVKAASEAKKAPAIVQTVPLPAQPQAASADEPATDASKEKTVEDGPDAAVQGPALPPPAPTVDLKEELNEFQKR